MMSSFFIGCSCSKTAARLFFAAALYDSIDRGASQEAIFLSVYMLFEVAVAYVFAKYYEVSESFVMLCP